jgi:hypothetical protein
MAIQCHDVPLSGFMSLVASRYARSTNKKVNRTGHLFERRHRAILVQADSYLKELVRYIHFNPVRSGLVDDLADYRWSSHLSYLVGGQPDWLSLNWVLSMFGKTITDARHQYASFMNADYQASIWQGLRHGMDSDCRILGDDGFRESFSDERAQQSVQKDLQQLTQEICCKYGVTEAELASASRVRRNARIRAEIGLAAVNNGIATNAEVARMFNRSQSALSRSINRLRRQTQ